MSRVFRGGIPKKSENITLNELRDLIKKWNVPTSAMERGDGTYKIFMSGAKNYYVPSSQGLVQLLSRYGIHIRR